MEKIKGIWGIIGAMASEVALLTARMEDASTLRVAGMDFHYGTLEGVPAVVAQCGVGKVCAALCAQAMIDRFHVAALVNTGVAGGVAAGLSVGDLVIGAGAVQHDFDITAFGHVKGYMDFGPDGGDGTRPTRFDADPRLVSAFRTAADAVLGAGKTREGIIASGDVFVSDDGVKREIASRFGAAAVEMEGGATRHRPLMPTPSRSSLCGRSPTLRGKGAHVSFDEFEKAAAESCAEIVTEMLRRAAG